MTDWMLYDFAKNHTAPEIQHRIEWYTKGYYSWSAEFIKASNEKVKAENRVAVAENQMKCYANQAKELTALAKEFNKVEVEIAILAP